MKLPQVKAPFILPSRFKPVAGNIHKVLKWKFSFREGAGKNSKKAGLEELAQPEDYKEEKYKKTKKNKQTNQWSFVSVRKLTRFKGESVILLPHSYA